VTPVRRDDQKQASKGECNACDDGSHCGHLEGRDLSGDQPDTGEQDQEESDLGEGFSSLRAHGTDGSYFDQSEPCRLPSGTSLGPRTIPKVPYPGGREQNARPNDVAALSGDRPERGLALIMSCRKRATSVHVLSCP